MARAHQTAPRNRPDSDAAGVTTPLEAGAPPGDSAPPRRGSYRKGVAKRDEIVRAALDAFSEQGFRGSSIRQIAQRVGLTQQGLMHHFDSKEQLLAEVLTLRDTLDIARFDVVPVTEGLRSEVVFNATRPGLVRLYTVLSAEATDPEHPAHEFFAARYRSIGAVLEERLREECGELLRGRDPALVSRLAMAVMDGLQIQWLLSDDAEMPPVFDLFLELLGAASPTPAAESMPADGPEPARAPRSSNSSKPRPLRKRNAR